MVGRLKYFKSRALSEADINEMRHLKNRECYKATSLNFASIFIFIIIVVLNPKIAFSQDSIPDTIKTIDSTIIAVVLGFVPQDSPTPSALVYKLKESEPPKTINLSQIVEVVDGQSGNMLYQNNISKAMKVVFIPDSIPDTIKTVDETILGIVMGFVPENSSFPRALVYRPNESEPAITLLLNQVVEVVDGQTGYPIYQNNDPSNLKNKLDFLNEYNNTIGCAVIVVVIVVGTVLIGLSSFSLPPL